MNYLANILAGVSLVTVAIMAVYIHDTDVLLDAKDRRIAALEAAHEVAKSDADFERVRCDAFYDVVGDYIDVTNEIKALGWSDSVLPN